MDIIEMLYVRFANIWGDRFTSRHTPMIIEMWYEDWLDGLQGIDPACFRDALRYCRENLEWSPSIAEFMRICDRSLNIPGIRQCMEAIIRRDFYHPLIEAIYKKMDTWELQGKEDKVLQRITELHQEEMINFRRKRSLSAQPLTEIEDQSHGSEVSGNNTRGTGVRKASGYIF
jgi:hypothetical protein